MQHLTVTGGSAFDRERRLGELRVPPKTRAFASVVFFHPEPIERQALEAEFSRIRDCGFDSVRYHHFMDPTARLVPTFKNPALDFADADIWLDAAAATGIKIIFHIDTLVPNPGALFSDTRARDETVRRYRHHPGLLFWAAFGEPHGTRLVPEESDGEEFARWLRERYRTVDDLEAAWNVYSRGATLVRDFDEAWRVAGYHQEADDINGVNRALRSYGAQRDARRFFTERAMDSPIEFIKGVRALDPDHDFLVGSHQLFLNQPSLGWDIREWAQLAPLFGTSIHLSWHFEPVGGEVTVPVYLQARYTRDANPWGTTGAYETTGGPVQHSGGYGNHMDRRLMRRLILSYIAAGNDSVAFWTWNGRPGGWEAGEYGLVGLSGKVTDWGVEAGRLSRALLAFAPELAGEANGDAGTPYRDVVGEPVAGVLLSWDSQAIQTLEPERHDLKREASELSSGSKMSTSRGWIGTSRAMVEGQVPFRYFHVEQEAYLDPTVVPVLVAPYLRALTDEHLQVLHRYVERGGTLIADCTFGYYDRWGRLRVPGKDTPQVELFGGWIDAVHDNRTGRKGFRGERVARFYGTVEVAGASPIAWFDDGSVAATSFCIGKGEAILVGFEFGEPCVASADNAVGRFLRDRVRAALPAAWSSTVATTYRRRTAGAGRRPAGGAPTCGAGCVDHYFIINDGPATDCVVRSFDRVYESAEVVVADLDVGDIGNRVVCDRHGAITCFVAADSAQWIRAW